MRIVGLLFLFLSLVSCASKPKKTFTQKQLERKYEKIAERTRIYVQEALPMCLTKEHKIVLFEWDLLADKQKDYISKLTKELHIYNKLKKWSLLLGGIFILLLISSLIKKII